MKGTASKPSVLVDIEQSLSTLDPDHSTIIEEVMPAIRTVTKLDSLALVSPVQGLDHLQLERFHSAGLRDTAVMRERFIDLFARSRRYAWYDPVSPEPEQRDRVLEATDLMTAEQLEQSLVYRTVLRPSGLENLYQPRILICEGPHLLGWFGAFHHARARPAQRRLLARVAGPLRARLSLERRLRQSPLHAAALDAALDCIGDPAFVVGAQGQLLVASASARALLATRGADLRQALVDAVMRRGTSAAFEMVALRERGLPDAYLLILRARERDRVAAALVTLGRDWKLTARQREVLAYAVEGHAVATIAQLLHLSLRTVELHLTALFDKAGVDSRAALLARVLHAVR